MKHKPISFSHLGEIVFAEMVNCEREPILRTLQLSKIADLDFVRSLDRFAFHESKLRPHGGYSFDGSHRVDVVLWISKQLAVACELKLGFTGLSKNQIDRKFLGECSLSSHKPPRVAGSMMAILDRKFDSFAPSDGLSVQLGSESIPLARDWFIIVQQQVLDGWTGNARPTFSYHTKCKSIDEIVCTFGGKEKFNRLVKRVLDFDYYAEWMSTTEYKFITDWSSCPAVERDPQRVSGAWVFRGTRVPVAALFENLEDGAQVSQFVEWFPGVSSEQVRAILEHAARSTLTPA